MQKRKSSKSLHSLRGLHPSIMLFLDMKISPQGLLKVIIWVAGVEVTSPQRKSWRLTMLSRRNLLTRRSLKFRWSRLRLRKTSRRPN